MLSPPTLVALCVAVFLIHIILRAKRSPLSHIPGPWHTLFSGLSLKIAIIKGRRIHHVHALHQKYGPIVRLSLTEMSVTDIDAVAQIHRVGSQYVKSPWYESAHKGRDPGLFAIQDPVAHMQRRRLFARAFSYTSLATNWEATVREKCALAVERIKFCAIEGVSDARNRMQGADVLKWWTLMATDVIAHLSFGESFHMLELGRKTTYVEALMNTMLSSVIRHEIPLVWYALRYIPVKRLRAIPEAEFVVYEHGGRAIQNMRRETGATQNLFGQMEAANEKGGGMIKDEDVKAEAGNFIIAGSDTTAVTLTYLVWAVLKQPALRKDLEDEISGLSEDLELVELMNSAPLLNSVIEEALRLYGAAPGALPRIVPNGGARFAGYNIAAGVEVSTQAFTLHRDRQYWKDPLRFDGYRFINKSSMTPAQKTLMQPFGGGSRVCIGLHLAWIELRLGAAMFFRHCKGARLSPQMTDEMMEMDNRFVISPKGHCCYVLL